jgi:hypothetical protein
LKEKKGTGTGRNQRNTRGNNYFVNSRIILSSASSSNELPFILKDFTCSSAVINFISVAIVSWQNIFVLPVPVNLIDELFTEKVLKY